jgi:hypothetical protein
MPNQKMEPRREPPPRSERRVRRGSTRTNARVAIWNAVTALAIIAVLFITFYGLAAQRDEGGGSTSTAATPAPAQTTTGQGGTPNDDAK